MDGPETALTRPGPGSRRSPPLITIGERRAATTSQFHLTEQTSAVAVRSRTLMSDDATRVLHVTSAAAGEGVSTVTRELVHAVSRMQLCKTLLLDAHPGGDDQAKALGGVLPDIIAGYEARGTLEVTEFEFEGSSFQAARWPAGAASPVIPALSNLLRSVYDLIVVDCPPILAHPYLPDISGGRPQVLMVVRSEVSSVRLVQRARREIEGLRGTVWGVVLAGQRQVLPRALDRWF